MKKIALILLACVYVLSSLGIGIKQFYCCGKVKYTHLSMVQNATGQCSKGNEKSGCCQTKFKSLQVKDSHVAADSIISPDRYFTSILFHPTLFQIMPVAAQPTDIFYAGNAPPTLHGIPIYIFCAVYRI